MEKQANGDHAAYAAYDSKCCCPEHYMVFILHRRILSEQMQLSRSHNDVAKGLRGERYLLR